MIDGNLGSRIYHVNLTGFDTHSNQLLRHAELLDNLFRRLYSTVLSDWFGIPAEDVLSVFESEYERFPFIESTSTVGTDDANVPITFTLDP